VARAATLTAVKRLAVAALATAAVVALGLGVRVAVATRPNASPPSRSAAVTPTPTASARPPVEQAVPFVPKPEDFTLAVRRTGTTCRFAVHPPAEFADQRIIDCKATYRTTASYHGKALDPKGTYIVFYQMVGTALGGEAYSITLESGSLPVLPVRSALVRSGAALSAIATDVEWLPAR
jgi:hypothetical protein